MPLQNSPIYDIQQSFEQNATYGPFWNEEIAKTVNSPTLKTSFLGFSLNSAFGVAACPISCNSRYVSLLSQLGYDLISYKSVRSQEWRGNPAPHWRYADLPQLLEQSAALQPVLVSTQPFPNQEVSMVNSFGIHSLKPEYWQADVVVTLSKLQPGQLLILSLMATPQPNQKLTDDAQKLGRLALQTGVEVFELNLACPNTDKGAGLIYEDIKLATQMCQAMKQALGDKKLLVKVGYYKDQLMMRSFMEQNVGIIDGIASINTGSGPIAQQDGKDVFPGRPTAGISGAAVRNIAMKQAQNLTQYKKELKLKDFAVIGIGGVTKPEHIDQYLDLGVDAVQSSVGIWDNPFLGQEYKQGKK